ncbi:MAG: CPBP family intramembrane metalloprotease [Rhizobium sp.]|nr:CPBP family intramembrane metalloprotease [Rhizobium sp.]
MKYAYGSARLPLSLAVYILWAAITILGGIWLSGGQQQSLSEGLSKGPLWNVIAAFLFLVAVILITGWRDLKFGPPDPMSSLRIMWLPALYILGFLSIAGVLGLPPFNLMLLILISTAFVGLSEETMFRGILFQALRTRVKLWPAMIWTSVLFGSVHILNALTTGEFLNALLQAFTATLSGFAFIAILVRTGSIWPAIIYHALWDFGTFSISASSQAGAEASGGNVGGWAFLLPVGLVLPNFLYGVYLLRNVRNDDVLSTDKPLAA